MVQLCPAFTAHENARAASRLHASTGPLLGLGLAVITTRACHARAVQFCGARLAVIMAAHRLTVAWRGSAAVWPGANPPGLRAEAYEPGFGTTAAPENGLICLGGRVVLPVDRGLLFARSSVFSLRPSRQSAEGT